MTTTSYSIEIRCPIDKVYEVSQDYSVRYEWDPFPERIDMLDGASEVAVGERVKIIAKSGLKMVVEFIQVNPPHVAAIKMVEGPFFLDVFAGSWVFKTLDNGNTQAVFKYSIRAKSWMLPSITNKIILWYFKGQVKSRLESLASYCNKQI